jgi:acid phosphatase (class A)|tara:strand:- start:580 stop:1107 length:528 start_codon:yes stop_codon:yes gene_type:complete
MELLKNFPVKKYLDKKPPSDNSTTTKGEIKELTKIPIREKFIKEKDDIKKSFNKIVKEDKLVEKLIDSSAPIILKIKKHYNRPRPKVIAKKMKTKMEDMEMASMKTPSYPSGHSVQGYLIGMALSKMYPQKRNKLMKTARDISYSRRVARAHYKSDSLFGEQIGKDMYNHIKNKI